MCAACLGDQLVVAQDVVRALERPAEQVLPLLGLALTPGDHTAQQLVKHPAGVMDSVVANSVPMVFRHYVST